jgi:hypothetical protein
LSELELDGSTCTTYAAAAGALAEFPGTAVFGDIGCQHKTASIALVYPGVRITGLTANALNMIKIK